MQIEEIEVTPLKAQKFRRQSTYQEVVDSIPVGRFHYLLLLTCGLCYMAVSVEIIGMSVITFSANCDLNFTLYQKGIVLTTSYLGSILSMYVMGFLADTKGRVNTLKKTVALSILSSFLSVFSVNAWMLIALRFFTGFFISACQSCVFTLLGEYHGKDSRMKHLTILAGFLPFGIIYIYAVGVVVSLIDVESYIPILSSWRLILLGYILPSVLARIGLAFIPESPKFVLAKGGVSQCVGTFRKISVMNNGKAFNPELITIDEDSNIFKNVDGVLETVKHMWDQSLSLFHSDRILETVKLSFVGFTLSMCGAGVSLWIPTIARNIIASTKEHTLCNMVRLTQNTTNICPFDNEKGVDLYLFLTAIFAIMFLIFIATSVHINIMGRKIALVTWLSFGGLASCTLYFSTVYLINVTALIFVVQAANLIGVVAGVATEYYPTNINAMGVCFVMLASRLGVVAGGNLVGPLLLTYCNSMFLVFALLFTAVMLLSLKLPYRSSK
ncbi:hypothetical protein ACFFRR_000111 [Megaselia abdita]